MHAFFRKGGKPGTDVIIFLNILAEKFGKKFGIFGSKQS
jgi:hypothetical protein